MVYFVSIIRKIVCSPINVFIKISTIFQKLFCSILKYITKVGSTALFLKEVIKNIYFIFRVEIL